jgi:polar amino acid transport system substrate-binding protein
MLLAVFAMVLANPVPAIGKSEPLIVGMELSYPPFEMTDEHGTPTGVSVDLAYALGEFLGRKVVIRNTSFDGLIPALKTGKIDLIISSMTATAERMKSIGFSEPYLKTGLCLLVRKDVSGQSIADFTGPGRVITVKKGTTGHVYVARHPTEAKVLVLDKESSCVLEVVQGKADAFIYDQMSTYRNWKRHQNTTRPLLEPFQEESWAIGVRKENDALREQVNAFLKDFSVRGGFARLSDRYLREQKEAFQKLGIPFLF